MSGAAEPGGTEARSRAGAGASDNNDDDDDDGDGMRALAASVGVVAPDEAIDAANSTPAAVAVDELAAALAAVADSIRRFSSSAMARVLFNRRCSRCARCTEASSAAALVVVSSSIVAASPPLAPASSSSRLSSSFMPNAAAGTARTRGFLLRGLSRSGSP